MQTDAALPPIDYLAVGHICRDIVPGGTVTGGAAAYATGVAQALGCRAGVVTSAAPRDEFDGVSPAIPICRVDAATTTVFENLYSPDGRRQQIIHAVAADLGVGHVPPLWSRAPMVHLGPIANEIDPAIIHLFSNSMVCIVPQGWMRRWDERGCVYQVDWETAAEVLPLATVTVISIEDLPDPAKVADYAALAPLLVVTDGAHGCTVHHRGEARTFAAPAVEAVDVTGAGDIFAAAYLVRLHQTGGDMWEAAVFANRVAGYSVTRRGLPAKIEAIRRLLPADAGPPAKED